MADEPLQTDEVVQILNLCRRCALVRLRPEGYPVQLLWIEHDDEDRSHPWRITCVRGEIPDRPLLERALALDFSLGVFTWYDDGPVYALTRGCFGVTAAAIKALRLARMLPGVSADEWLWVTVPEYEQCEPPAGPPTPWPPVIG